MKDTSKVTIHMVASLDGFIAKKDGTVSWLQSTDHYEDGVTLSDEYIEDFLKSIDCYVMGSHTYEQALVLGWPYGEVPVVVLTKRALKSERENVQFYSGDLNVLLSEKLKPQYNNIWMVGGAEVTKAFIQQGLVDDLIVSMVPVLLGDGTLFFDFVGREQALHLKDVKAFKDGMVELWYEIKK